MALEISSAGSAETLRGLAAEPQASSRSKVVGGELRRTKTRKTLVADEVTATDSRAAEDAITATSTGAERGRRDSNNNNCRNSDSSSINSVNSIARQSIHSTFTSPSIDSVQLATPLTSPPTTEPPSQLPSPASSTSHTAIKRDAPSASPLEPHTAHGSSPTAVDSASPVVVVQLSPRTAATHAESGSRSDASSSSVSHSPPSYRISSSPGRRPPASRSCHGVETLTGPPPAVSTQRSSSQTLARRHRPTATLPDRPNITTVVHQHTVSTPSTPKTPAVVQPRSASRSLDETTTRKPFIPPIRSFRSSSQRQSVEMTSRRLSRLDLTTHDHDLDRDRTLRALEGFSADALDGAGRRVADVLGGRDAADEDMFLRLAQDDLTGHATVVPDDHYELLEARRSRIRQSLPPLSYQSPKISRLAHDVDSPDSRYGLPAQQETPESDHTIRASLYRSPGDRSRRGSLQSQDEANRFRNPYSNMPSFASPLSPRSASRRERSPEAQSQVSYPGRASISEVPAASRPYGHKQSSLSYSRVYSSSPLVGRTTDVSAGSHSPTRNEGTESTASTAAPSTVWDELDDLKSRIRKLELTGKLPPTSGAAMSSVSGERPQTATTTVTTVSSSPRRRRNSATTDVNANLPGDNHPLLRSALANTKQLLSPEVYKALEAAAADALAISAMMGMSGQPGPLSSAQSAAGAGVTVASDRQVRRKADNMCRSLTELCLALSEKQAEPVSSIAPQTIGLALSHDSPADKSADVQPSPRQVNNVNDQPLRFKPSPRATSRLDARRHSQTIQLNNASSPRYTSLESTTPTPSNISGRRSSMLLRTRRAATEEPEDEDPRLRAPSRANTEIGRARVASRIYTSEEPLPLHDSPRALGLQSSLPIRRSLTTTSTHSSPGIPTLGGRRYLDRTTPDRDATVTLTGRMSEERPARKNSLGAADNPRPSVVGSLLRRARQS